MKDNIESGENHSNEKSPDTDRKDYAEFLDLAVHELDAPLRKISVMVEKIAQKYESGEQDQARQYLGRAISGLAEMRSSLDALYKLNQLETEQLVISNCDTNLLVDQVMTELKASNKEKTLKETHQNLPVLKGDLKQIRQLFRELLQNAIRFNENKVNVQVEITSSDLSAREKKELKLSENENYFKLVICDNGIGFAKEDAKKMFKPFVRLNGRSAYPGNGMGLAICKKIVDSHNGIIYAEPNQHSGSSILLILPQRLN